jgi:hypothetical protein
MCSSERPPNIQWPASRLNAHSDYGLTPYLDLRQRTAGPTTEASLHYMSSWHHIDEDLPARP